MTPTDCPYRIHYEMGRLESSVPATQSSMVTLEGRMLSVESDAVANVGQYAL